MDFFDLLAKYRDDRANMTPEEIEWLQREWLRRNRRNGPSQPTN